MIATLPAVGCVRFSECPLREVLLYNDNFPVEFMELYVKYWQPHAIETKLDELGLKQDEVSMKLMPLNKEPMEDITSDIREELQDLTVEVQKTKKHSKNLPRPNR